MNRDGEIDYTRMTSAQLEEALGRTDAVSFPDDFARLTAEIDRRKAAAAPVASSLQHLQFTGAGAEYFRIWIVNLALTIVTLGIYSAWAKVRKQRYFYASTKLAGSAFGYHADPVKILKGRIIAVILLAGYFLARRTSATATLLCIAVLALLTPWLIVKSRRFAMRVTSWRGIRFNFQADYKGAYATFVGWLLLTMITLGILGPRMQRERYRYLVSRAGFGSESFECNPGIAPFYYTVLGAIGLFFGVMVVAALVGVVAAVTGVKLGKISPKLAPLLVLPVYAILLPVMLGYTHARNMNEVVNHTTLGPHQLHGSYSAGKLIWIYFSNIVLIVCTLGFYTPWAQIRLARYRAESIAIEPHGSLDELAASGAPEVPSAVSEEISSFFDLDFGF